jgi:hypothetical protein
MPNNHIQKTGAEALLNAKHLCPLLIWSVILSAEGIQATVQFECSLSSLRNAHNA